jgi:hypothetical protein
VTLKRQVVLCQVAEGDFRPRHEWRTGARIWPNGGANIQIKIRRAGAAGNQCADLNHIVKLAGNAAKLG